MAPAGQACGGFAVPALTVAVTPEFPQRRAVVSVLPGIPRGCTQRVPWGQTRPRACVSLPGVGDTGDRIQALGTSASLGSGVWSCSCQIRVGKLRARLEGLGRAGKGWSAGRGMHFDPSPARAASGCCLLGGSGGDVRPSFPSSVFWSLSRENQPQDPAPLIALSHSPGVRDSQQ